MSSKYVTEDKKGFTLMGVVRHYHCHDRESYYKAREIDHPPYSYSGLIKDSHDLSGNVLEDLRKKLTTLPDGEKISIVVTQHGTSDTAKGFVWAWLRPNEYGRIPREDYEKMVQVHMNGNKRNTYDDISKKEGN